MLGTHDRTRTSSVLRLPITDGRAPCTDFRETCSRSVCCYQRCTNGGIVREVGLRHEDNATRACIAFYRNFRPAYSDGSCARGPASGRSTCGVSATDDLLGSVTRV